MKNTQHVWEGQQNLNNVAEMLKEWFEHIQKLWKEGDMARFRQKVIEFAIAISKWFENNVSTELIQEYSQKLLDFISQKRKEVSKEEKALIDLYQQILNIISQKEHTPEMFWWLKIKSEIYVPNIKIRELLDWKELPPWATHKNQVN